MSNPLKRTMVYLGLAEEDLPTETQAQPTEQPTSPQSAQRKQPEKAAAVTPLRKLQPTRQPQPQQLNEILTVHPQQYSDARVIAENFRHDVPVIMNLSRMTDADAKRIIDFASGLVMGLNGHIERVTGKVFLLAPEHIAPKSEEDLAAETSDSGSFFVSAAQ